MSPLTISGALRMTACPPVEPVRFCTRFCARGVSIPCSQISDCFQELTTRALFAHTLLADIPRLDLCDAGTLHPSLYQRTCQYCQQPELKTGTPRAVICVLVTLRPMLRQRHHEQYQQEEHESGAAHASFCHAYLALGTKVPVFFIQLATSIPARVSHCAFMSLLLLFAIGGRLRFGRAGGGVLLWLLTTRVSPAFPLVFFDCMGLHFVRAQGTRRFGIAGGRRLGRAAHPRHPDSGNVHDDRRSCGRYRARRQVCEGADSGEGRRGAHVAVSAALTFAAQEISGLSLRLAGKQSPTRRRRDERFNAGPDRGCAMRLRWR